MMGDGKPCTSGRIVSKGECARAAESIGYEYGGSWYGIFDVPGCIFAKDNRQNVWFNSALSARKRNPIYVEICTDATQDTQELTVGNSQCDHINEDNKSYECSGYYKYVAKCDVCQDDNAGAVDNSAINAEISKPGMSSFSVFGMEKSIVVSVFAFMGAATVVWYGAKTVARKTEFTRIL